MTTSQTGLALIKKHEGLVLTAYPDLGGVYTIGYGHTATAKPGQTITRQQAESLLAKDVKTAEAAVLKSVKVPLTQNEFDALVSLVFNIGAGAFAGSTLLKFLNQGNKDEAAKQFLRWVNVNGRPVAGLMNRRKDEKTLFENSTGAGVLAFLALAVLFIGFQYFK